jgi:hypothetical protein
MKKYLLLLFMLLITFGLTTGSAYADSDTGSIYGHISYVEGNPKVVRADQTQEDAVVNLPVAPGDMVVTGEKSRCELQFDNGTVMRLGKKTRLKVTTVLAKSLTSKWKITTLELMEGKLYSLNQAYNKERFQVLTPNAAINLKKNSKTTIILKDGETHLACDRGKFEMMYGEDANKLKTETVRKGKHFIVTADHKLKENDKLDIDFQAWNQYINDNFKELHYGISKVPKKVYKYSKALVYWAEKWSSLVGDWVYDDLFGYVWRPAHDIYAHPMKLFLNASYVEVNGQLFLVPNEPWGWVPAHMGTWVWMKWGWTWVPGDAFFPGGSWYTYGGAFGYTFLNRTLFYWIQGLYGGYDLYYTYRSYGDDAWQRAYYGRYKTYPPKLSTRKLPKEIRNIIKKMNQTPVTTLKDRLGKEPLKTDYFMVKRDTLHKSPVNPTKINKKPAIGTAKPVKPTRISATSIVNKLKFARRTKESSNKKDGKAYRDFNPDKQWSLINNVKVRYSSKTNAVVAPALGLNSSRMTTRQAHALKRGSVGISRGSTGYYGSRSGGGNDGSTVSTSAVTTGSRGGGRGSGGGKSGPGGASQEKK